MEKSFLRVRQRDQTLPSIIPSINPPLLASFYAEQKVIKNEMQSTPLQGSIIALLEKLASLG